MVHCLRGKCTRKTLIEQKWRTGASLCSQTKEGGHFLLSEPLFPGQSCNRKRWAVVSVPICTFFFSICGKQRVQSARVTFYFFPFTRFSSVIYNWAAVVWKQHKNQKEYILCNIWTTSSGHDHKSICFWFLHPYNFIWFVHPYTWAIAGQVRLYKKT